MTEIDDVAPERAAELRAALARVKDRVSAAERAAGREPGSVRLLPVSKFHPVGDIAALAVAGVESFGENREQEAREKAAALPGVKFHMIGQIQTKKANSVARWAAVVESVDSVRLAGKLDRGVALAVERGERAEGELPCLVQWSADGDPERGGVPDADLDAVCAAVADAAHLRLAGLMCVPPLGADAGETFTRARAIVDNLGDGMILSAGMSADLEAAVAAGSDLVRVGTGIFGPRPLA